MKVDQVSYWDKNSRWYKLWREHNRYHEPIKRILYRAIGDGKSGLDVGAGDGILSSFMGELGFKIVALEPSEGMREYLSHSVRGKNGKVQIDPRRFEDVDPHEIRRYDFVVACNSLHLTEGGIELSLRKMFESKVRSIFIVTEKPLPSEILFFCRSYRLVFFHSYQIISSYAYHKEEELYEHFLFKKRYGLSTKTIIKHFKNLTYEDGHFWIRDVERVNIFLWRRAK
ncbi:MAG: class I SAM-dependent methyltransferase [Deltaproteobacteria bacterium]|nr:class I SAM-dependent methyltransferase [Deltaproteobacteria bacterium]